MSRFTHLRIITLTLLALHIQPAVAQFFDFKRTDTTAVLYAGDTLDFSWAGGMNYCMFSRVDMDLDGKKDLLVFDKTGNQLIPLRYTGGLGINYEYKPEFANLFPADINSWILMVDYNCDGKEDIFTYYPGGMRIFKNISDTILKFTLQVQLLRSSQLGNYINLLVTSVDVPAIEDIDYDGDKDIIVFGQFGKLLEYHRNYSIEYGYGCDSLPFILKNECWGNFYESSLNCSLTLFDTCPPNPFLGGPPEFAPTPAEYRAWFSSDAPGGTDVIYNDSRVHTGSTVLALDLNGQNTKELIIGDVSCSTLSAVYNGGTIPNTATSMISADLTFPSYDKPVDIAIFPGAYYVDIDNDTLRDLVASPNYSVGSNNYSGNWFYKNTGTDLTPVFDFNQSALFQSQMIEAGEGSVPVFFDHDGDGIKDLVVANFGTWDRTTYAYDRYVSQWQLYINNGTNSHPSFIKTDTNYQNIFSILDTTALLPTFADLDNDGDEDAIVGDVTGRVHRLQNTSGAGNPASFVVQMLNMIDDLGAIIDIGTNAAPHLFDADRDGDYDMIIGKQNGRIVYYENVGNSVTPSFRYITNNLGDVHVNEWWTTIGYSIPYVYDHKGKYHLFVGSLQGKVFHYDSLDNNLAGDFRLLDSLPETFNYYGVSSAPAVADINGDTLPELLIGNQRGGIVFYTAISEDTSTSIGISESTTVYSTLVYPNPASSSCVLKTDIPGIKNATVYMADGRIVKQFIFSQQETEINISELGSGLYLIKISKAQFESPASVTRLIIR